MKVLIVDDEEMIRGVLKEYVEFEGGEAYEAADGMQAVKLCRDNDFDIILMDIMMPRLDGFSAVKEIKKNKDIPVIMLSARGEEYDKLFGFEIGADDYVTKPFSPKEVMARIHAVLKRKSGDENNRDVLTFEGLTIDIAGRNVLRRRRKGGAHAQGVRNTVLFREEQGHCADPRKAFDRRVGIRFLRRRPHCRHSY